MTRKSRRFFSETGFGIQHGPIFTCLDEYRWNHSSGTVAEKPETSSYQIPMTTSAAALRFTKRVENVRRDVGIADMNFFLNLGVVRTVS